MTPELEEVNTETSFVNEEKINALRKQMKSDTVMADLAATFKVLGDLTRTKIIFALSKEVLCVSEIALLLSISQSAVSHQLRVLRDMKLVRSRKEGKVAYYSLDDVHITFLLRDGLRHVTEA
jgi:ArsR family transcriptional regulator